MNRLTRIMNVTAFSLLFLHLQGMAQGLVTPPKGLPEERWELTYDDYRARIYDLPQYSSMILDHNWNPDYPKIPSHDDLAGLRRNVACVRDGADVYIKGIFPEYPEAWIKCRVDGNKLTIQNNQVIDTDGPAYFHWGSSHLDIGWVHEYHDSYRPVDFADFKSCNERISFTVSDDGDSITSRKPDGYNEIGTYNTPDPAFWFDNDEKGDWLFSCELGGYPDFGYMVNMVFRKID